jgi:hypothetical protein
VSVKVRRDLLCLFDSQVKTWGKLLGTFCTTAKLEMDLIYRIQTHCYEDAKLMKLFPEIVQALYDQDVLAEDTVLSWFRKGTNPKGRYVLALAADVFSAGIGLTSSATLEKTWTPPLILGKY